MNETTICLQCLACLFLEVCLICPLVRLGGRRLIKLNEWAHYFQILIMGSYFSIYIRIVDTYVTLKLVFVENIFAIYFLKLVWLLDSIRCQIKRALP